MLFFKIYKSLTNIFNMFIIKVYDDILLFKYYIYLNLVYIYTYDILSLKLTFDLLRFSNQFLKIDYLYYWVVFYNNYFFIKKLSFFKNKKLNQLLYLKWGFVYDTLITSTFINKFFYSVYSYFNNLLNTSFSFSFLYLRGFFFILFIDACLTDDEPLWEPIEWSLVQVWIFFIFGFAWIAENLIVSRYGSYTGRDKRVWMAWYKSFWLIEIFYILNYGLTILFVITPYYFELQYNLSFIYSWWHWYSRVFFFKFISLFSLILLISYFLQISVRWLNWKKLLVLVILINIFLSYLIYTHFLIVFFSYFTDVLWYQKTRSVDYIQLSHEPFKWGWGNAKRDHFSPHAVKTVIWFKNDGPFATSFFFSHIFIFFSIFFLYLYWIVLFRRIYSTKEVPITFLTYCVSSLRQFFYCFLFFYCFIILSYLTQYTRYTIDFYWIIETKSWLFNFFLIMGDYPFFLINLFF